MTNFLILFIAMLITFDIIFGDLLILNLIIPLCALGATILISLLYLAAKKLWISKDQFPVQTQKHRNFVNYSNETEEERHKRINDEIDKIIHKK